MQDATPRLHHEDLDSYQASIAFLALAAKLLDQFPRGYGTMADQLKRASLSVPLNLAEGYGKRSQVDRARFYDIARGSAHECGALLDATRVLGLVDERTFLDAKTLLHRIISMLVKMSS
ncbi:MAG: four helix bundle protein [Deltaproteobacteria bacterium]|nr:four helix bundle protein [Deltaproteobacteria bacterium]